MKVFQEIQTNRPVVLSLCPSTRRFVRPAGPATGSGSAHPAVPAGHCSLGTHLVRRWARLHLSQMEPAPGILGNWEGLLQQQQPTCWVYPGEPVLQIQGNGRGLRRTVESGFGFVSVGIFNGASVCFPRRWATAASQSVKTKMVWWSWFSIRRKLMCELSSSSWWSPSTRSWEVTRSFLST